MRADAAQRREAIISHARHLFAERGGDVALEAVAAASGVGIATLYRNFPSRRDLVQAVITDTVQQILEAVARAREVADHNPGAAWEKLLSVLMGLELGALTDGLGLQTDQGAHETSVFADIQQPALDALDELLRVLQRGKAVRPGISALEVIVAVATITRPQVSPIRDAAPDVHSQLAQAYLLWTRTV